MLMTLTRVAQQSYLTNSKRKRKHFGRVSHPQHLSSNPAKKSPPLDELFPLSAVGVQWEKIDPRAERLRLGNSTTSNNKIMNWTWRYGSSIQRLEFSQVHSGAVDTLPVSLGCFIWSFVYSYIWFCSFLHLAQNPVELHLLLLLCPCQIRSQIPMLSLKSNLNPSFFQENSALPVQLTLFSPFSSLIWPLSLSSINCNNLGLPLTLEISLKITKSLQITKQGD